VPSARSAFQYPPRVEQTALAGEDKIQPLAALIPVPSVGRDLVVAFDPPVAWSN
jgi:hypothetical protein